MTRCFYNEDMYDSESAPDGRFDIAYKPIMPVADSTEFSGRGRLILQHGRGRRGYPIIIWVDSNEGVTSGWVIGVEA